MTFSMLFTHVKNLERDKYPGFIHTLARTGRFHSIHIYDHFPILNCDSRPREYNFNPFTPEFLKWTLSSLNMEISNTANRDGCEKSKTEWQTV